MRSKAHAVIVIPVFSHRLAILQCTFMEASVMAEKTNESFAQLLKTFCEGISTAMVAGEKLALISIQQFEKGNLTHLRDFHASMLEHKGFSPASKFINWMQKYSPLIIIDGSYYKDNGKRPAGEDDVEPTPFNLEAAEKDAKFWVSKAKSQPAKLFSHASFVEALLTLVNSYNNPKKFVSSSEKATEAVNTTSNFAVALRDFKTVAKPKPVASKPAEVTEPPAEQVATG